MRLYSITNMYTAGIHAGIQTQHSTVELFVKYPSINSSTSYQAVDIMEWAKNHKTTVVLNGGMHDNLMNLLTLLNDWEENDRYEVLPFAPFFEPGINNALTSISIVVPQNAIDYMSEIRSTKKDTPEYKDLTDRIYISYGARSIPVLEAIAFLQLAK